jgi:AraC-like DNA-binding protein
MPGDAQSIQKGSTRLKSVDLGGLRVTDALFPALLTLPSHYHECACFAVVLAGCVEKVFPKASYASAMASVVTMPPEERHTDHFGAAGAHMLVVEPGAADGLEELLYPCAAVLDCVNHFPDRGVTSMAWRISRELHNPDAVSLLAISGLVLEMLAMAIRRHKALPAEKESPAWLSQAREYLHANFNESFQVTDMAQAVGVHPVHLARVFRRHYGVSPSTYRLRLRLDWVATHLVRSDEPLSVLARRAGFADQSHLTRLFKRQTGLTPGQYRQATRPNR